MTEIFTGKSVEDAKAKAAAKFGKDIRYIRFEVVQEAKKGFLGIGAQDAKVKATYEPPVQKTAAPAAKPAAPVKSEEPKAEPVKAAAPAAEPAPAKEEAPKPVEAEAPKAEPAKEAAPAPADESASEKASENNADHDDDEDYSIDKFTLIEDPALIDPKVKLAIDYMTSIFNAIGVSADYEVYQNESGAIININSDNNGTIIGRRGETLDSVQYLCSIIANKGDKDYFRITIDCLGYRKKRKETLEQLAAKVARSVIRTGRSQPLEPMNPYERRVIHSAVSAIEGVSSRSVGEEPYRKIIISSTNPRNNNRRRDNKRDGGGRRNDRRNNPRNRDREVNMERRDVNLSTSFEKDYKRPKPEDSIEGGLYGKIEI